MNTTAGETAPSTRPATPRSVGWAVMQTIRNYGIDTVFGIPGTHNLELYRPLHELGIHPVTTRHEQGAGYGADGWSLRSGKPAVVLTTSGPGLLNALSAAGTAFCESRPMLIVSPGPAVGAEFADVGTLHETKDQLSAAQAIVQWGRRVTSAEAAVTAVHDAFADFATQRPRPVYLEIPLDVLESSADLAPELLAAREPEPRPAAATADIVAAAQLLTQASRPVIYAGGGSRGAAAEIRALAEALRAPVATSLNAKGVLPETHPLSLGANMRLSAVREVVRNAEVLLVVGAKLGEAELWVEQLDARGTVIRLDLSEAQLQKNQSAQLTLHGDAQATLEVLVSEVAAARPAPGGHAAPSADAAANYPAEGQTVGSHPEADLNGDDSGAAEARVAAARDAARAESRELDAVNTALGEAIAAAVPAEAILTNDSSKVSYWGLLNAASAMEPNQVLYMATYATLGYATPAAIGAKLASPDRPVIAVTGDGALMFSVNEFITAVEQGLDLVVIVVDNGGYEEIRDNEIAAGIHPVGVQLTQPNWPLLADAFGGTGVSLQNLQELGPAVRRALDAGGLQLIHLHQDLASPAGAS